MESILILTGIFALTILHCQASTPLGVYFPRSSFEAPDLWTPENSNESYLKTRIEENFLPENYRVELRTILDELVDGDVKNTVVGTVEITLNCQVATNTIHLHMSEITPLLPAQVKVWEEGIPNPEIVVNSVTETGTDTQIWAFALASDLAAEKKYVIKISNYKAVIADHKGPGGRMNGLYITTYGDGDDEKTLAVSHFSRTRAFRKLVPSFDDPKHKAKFEISIGRHASYRSLSNMDIRETVPIGTGFDDWFWDHYVVTPKMPPTVLAFVVYKEGELIPKVAEDTPLNKPVKVWGPPEIIIGNQADFSAKAVAEILTHLNTYFDIPYELPKMDSVGVNHFGAGAMENWGLNIYRSSYMFLNPEHSTAAQRLATASVVAHELAHQWWGNLVTHQWWNDWWLTEGFATYYAPVIVQEVYPEFDSKVRLVTDELQVAMAFDITAASVPIHGPDNQVNTNPHQIDYSKGSALVRMMSGFLTEPVFKRAVISYLKNRMKQAVTQNELFDDIEAALQPGEKPGNGLTIKQIMNEWTTQKGLPVVRVSKSQTTPNTIYLSQKPFIEKGSTDPSTAIWHIPITFASRANPNFGDRKPDLWLNNDGIMIKHAVANSKDWLVVNPEAKGYYRVLYDNYYGDLLREQLIRDLESISEASRSQIIDDYLSAAFELYIRFNTADRMTDFIGRDGRLGSWISFLRHFKRAFNLMRLSTGNDLQRFKNYLLPKVQAGLAAIHTPAGSAPENDQSIQTQILRSVLLDWECAVGDDGPCEIYSDEVFDRWMLAPTEPNPIPVELRSVVYCRAASRVDAQHGNIWDFLRQKYTETGDVTMLNALRCTEDAAKLGLLMVDALVGDHTPEEGWGLFTVLAGSTVEMRDEVIGILADPEDLTAIVTKYRLEGITDVINAIVPLVSVEEEILAVEKIVGHNPLVFQDFPEVRSKIASAAAAMRANRDWLPKFQERFLENFPPLPTQ